MVRCGGVYEWEGEEDNGVHPCHFLPGLAWLLTELALVPAAAANHPKSRAKPIQAILLIHCLQTCPSECSITPLTGLVSRHNGSLEPSRARHADEVGVYNSDQSNSLTVSPTAQRHAPESSCASECGCDRAT